MALGALIIQTRFQFSDRELVQQITENPYLQYFIGLPGYQETPPIDATCAPVYIRYPQYISLLNEAREKPEEMIFWFHKAYGVALPRRDCKAARKQYLSFAKSKKHSAKQIRKALKKQLSYVKRNIGYLEGFMSSGLSPRQKDIPTILTIFKLYEQQKFIRSEAWETKQGNNKNR